jgi:hypothetical protein
VIVALVKETVVGMGRRKKIIHRCPQIRKKTFYPQMNADGGQRI